MITNSSHGNNCNAKPLEKKIVTVHRDTSSETWCAIAKNYLTCCVVSLVKWYLQSVNMYQYQYCLYVRLQVGPFSEP